VHQHLWNDSSSFHPVHPLIRAFGPKVLHHAKGHCPAYRRLAPFRSQLVASMQARGLLLQAVVAETSIDVEG